MSARGSASVVRLDAERAAVLHARAGAVRWHVRAESFQVALERSIAHRFPGATSPSADELDTFLDGLHLEDLALAVGCAEGLEPAWEAFLARHQSELRRAAAAIGGETEGDEIIDALLVDLFARGEAGSPRRSLFEYFHGRSRLSTWLRALLSQRHVDRLRASRRLTPLDEDADACAQIVDKAVSPDPDRARLVSALHRALDEGLAALEPRDRLRLACYHADGLTLAAIGRLLKEHEATVSRKLQRSREALRLHIDSYLTRELGLDTAQLRDCYEYAIEDGGLELARLKALAPSPDS
jgi:RNA polymerase sigma-70 factor